MKRAIRFLDKASTIVAIPLFIWMVVGQILVHLFKLPLYDWYLDVGVVLMLLFMSTAGPWLFLRAMAYEEKE